MKVFIKYHDAYAGKWIYQGYYNAWSFLGYEPHYYNSLEELINEKDYLLMTLDSCITEKNISILERAKKVFLYVQPNYFEHPWGLHPNFVSLMDKKLIPIINNNKNIYKWTFTEKSKYFFEWDTVNTIPLAFDNYSYNNFTENNKYTFDVCFIGSRANNAYDEKYKIMLEVFEEFRKSNLKCGFFIEKKISHEEEKNIIFNSKVCLNIHDAYQRKLGLDTNERTFKSLGINGILVSDSIKQLNRLFPNLQMANNSSEYVDLCFKYINLNKETLSSIKNSNRKYILENHTYSCRIKQMLSEVYV